MKTPDDISKGKNIPVQAAIAASAPPRAKDPIPPIHTEALYLLWKRKPMQAPAIDAPKIASSVPSQKGEKAEKSDPRT